MFTAEDRERLRDALLAGARVDARLSGAAIAALIAEIERDDAALAARLTDALRALVA